MDLSLGLKLHDSVLPNHSRKNRTGIRELVELSHLLPTIGFLTHSGTPGLQHISGAVQHGLKKGTLLHRPRGIARSSCPSWDSESSLFQAPQNHSMKQAAVKAASSILHMCVAKLLRGIWGAWISLWVFYLCPFAGPFCLCVWKEQALQT